MADVTHLRRSFAHAPLFEADAPTDPFVFFGRWMDEAVNDLDANAMTLATVDVAGMPQARTVLLRGYGPTGFVFYTNYESDKAKELQAHPQASLLFFWPERVRQVRIAGRVEKVSAAESDAYFASRPRGHQLGAWASHQSSVIADRSVLEEEMRQLEARFPDAVPRPAHWGGFRLLPDVFEFWQGQDNRLHDRLRYTASGSRWLRQRLAP